MSDFLDQMAAHSQARADALLGRFREAELFRRAASHPGPPPLVLSGGFDLIAECKFQAPSWTDGAQPAPGSPETAAARARSYAQAGAAAVSVLTEPSRFSGALSHLVAASRAAAELDVPVMRKDFLVHPVQVVEARLAGAGGVLLITAMVSDRTLSEMLDVADELDMFALVECFDADDLARTQAALSKADGTCLVGVNSRNLRTLQVDPTRLGSLVPELPPGVPAVAESGLHTPADARRARELGYRLALVGSALMVAPGPSRLVQDMVAAGRGAAETGPWA